MPESPFGEAMPPRGTELHPEGIYPFEVGVRPRSLSLLADCSDALRALVSLPLDNSFVPAMLVGSTILYAIDENGRILVALEEFAPDDPLVSGEFAPVPFPRNIKQAPFPKRLGHGSMLQGEKGRISGEIKLMNSGNRWLWEINNNSGRYGRFPSRTEMQLKAVSATFSQLNINLEARFYARST